MKPMLLLTILLFTPFARGESALTLPQALSEARAGNANLKQLEARRDSVSWRKLQSLAGYLPHLTLEAQHLFNTKYARLNVLFGGNAVGFPSAVPQDSVNLTASLTVFDGFGSWNGYRAAAHESSAAEHELNYATFQLEHEVTLKFDQALAAAALKSVADENIKSLEEHLTLARANERSGMGTHFNVLRLEAQLEEARAEKALAEDNLVIARVNLERVLGHEGADPRALEGELPEPRLDAAVAKLTADTGAREDLKAETEREAAVDSQSAAANAFWFPKVSLFAQEQFYKFGAFDPQILPNSSFQNAYALGVRLNWDLFDGGASFAKRQEAAAHAKEAAERTHAALQQVSVDFETWKRRYLYNSALYRARLRTIEKSQESVRLAKLGLRAGTSTNSEVLDAELDLFRARAGVVRAQADAAEALLRLELASGHPITAR